jgi:hypothetical protein
MLNPGRREIKLKSMVVDEDTPYSGVGGRG